MVQENHEGNKDVERIAAFSDAIFAFSMTVLALEVKIPDVIANPVTELPSVIVGQLPHFLSFVIGFLVVALYWASHHRMFRLVRRVNGRLIWTNIFFLMFIAFMPVPTGYLAEYGDVPLITAIYAVVVIACSVMEWLVWNYAASYGLIDKNISPRLIRLYQWRTVVPAIVFVISIPIAFIFDATVAKLCWILIWPALTFVSNRYRDVAPQIYGDA